MKKYSAIFLLCAFLSYLGAEEDTKQSEENLSQVENVDLNGIAGFDVYQQVKGFILMAFSQCPETPVFTEMFAEPIIKTYVDGLEGIEQKTCIQRLYTLGVASEILYNPEIDIDTGSIEEYRLHLEQEYDMQIDTYKVLQVQNERRIDYACLLYTSDAADE